MPGAAFVAGDEEGTAPRPTSGSLFAESVDLESYLSEETAASALSLPLPFSIASNQTEQSLPKWLDDQAVQTADRRRG